MTSPHQWGHSSSLDPTFVPEFRIVWNPVKPAFALALHRGFLNLLSWPLGTTDIFSAVSRPRQTVRQQLSSFSQVKRYRIQRVVSHCRLHGNWRSRFSDSYLYWTSYSIPQLQATVKFYGVFASHWNSLDFAPESCVREDLGKDSGDLVTPFMQVVNQTTRHFAHEVLLLSIKENDYTFLHSSLHRYKGRTLSSNFSFRKNVSSKKIFSTWKTRLAYSLWGFFLLQENLSCWLSALHALSLNFFSSERYSDVPAYSQIFIPFLLLAYCLTMDLKATNSP